MEPGFSSLLYTRPWLYEVVLPDAEETVAGMCRVAFARYLEGPPRSVMARQSINIGGGLIS